MENVKPSYTSLTVISSLLIVVVSTAKLLGYDLSVLLDMQEDVVILIGAALALYGRIRATSQLSLV